MSGSTTVGVIGLGLMGLPMALRLAEAGFEVVATSRTAPEPTSLPDGIRFVDIVGEVLRSTSTVIGALPRGEDTEAAIRATRFERIAATTFVDVSTCGPTWAGRLAAGLAAHSIDYIDAPVSGGPAGARAGTLSIMVGGSAAAYERVLPVLRALGTPERLGPIGAGQAAKLVNQTLIAGIMSGIADAHRLAQAVDLDLASIPAAVAGGFGDSALLRWAWPRIVDGDFSPGFKVAHMIKDLGLAETAAAEHGVRLALTERVRIAYEGIERLTHGAGTHAIVRYNSMAAAERMSERPESEWRRHVTH